jgi:hypothetical protein
MRSISSHGYVRVRWRVGVNRYVETYEHRLVAGLDAEHVHHRNGIKTDNRPENLERISTLDHGERHSCINIHEASDLYASGWSLPRLGAFYGVHSSSVLRSLRARGVKFRTPAEGRRALRPVDETMLRTYADAGLGVRSIALLMGETRSVIKARFRALGIPLRRPGNYTRAEKEAYRKVTRHEVTL